MVDVGMSLLAETPAKLSDKFDIERLALPEVFLVKPRGVFRDRRGLFTETFRAADLAPAFDGIEPHFVQGSFSISAPFTLRGMHYQINNPQGKFLQIAQGSIFDVAVDLRRSSPNFGKWCGAVLKATEPSAIFIPPGFAHGFMAFNDGATVFYLCTTYHDPKSDRGVLWNDPEIGIAWPLGPGAVTVMSGKDRNAPRLADAEVFE